MTPFPGAFFSATLAHGPEAGKEAPASDLRVFSASGRMAHTDATNGDVGKSMELTDADILLGLVGRPLPWWRHIGW